MIVDMDVSVIIPCHNASSWIIRALESVASQSLKPREVIVIDDASTDDSVAKVTAWSKEVVLLRMNHRNAAMTRNSGIHKASGKWIALLDADDEWLPSHLAHAAEVLSGAQSVAFMGTSLYVTHDSQPVMTSLKEASNRTESELIGVDFVRWFGQTFSFPNITIVYLRDRVLEVNGFDDTLPRRHDFELFMRVIHGRTWAYSPVPTTKAYVDTPGSISRDICECYYYGVRALMGLYPLYGKEIKPMIRAYSSNALGATVRYGSHTQLKRVYHFCSTEVSTLRRVAFKVACIVPNIAKRLLTWLDRI